MSHVKPVRAAIACTLAFMGSGCALVMPIESHAPVQRYAAAEYTWQAMNIIDAAQTLHIAKSQRTDEQMQAKADAGLRVDRYCYREANFMTRALIGEHPSQSSVLLSSLAFAVIHYTVSAWIEQRDTLNEYGEHNSPWVVAAFTWHAIGIVTKGSTIINNHSIGLRIGGSGCAE